ncbi:MAG TPA: putative dsRNA-binding protein, partial [Rhabdaerophilum sp.]|nr:putative dsRNA-binding protein [Rhabdaerophilum sp.]
RPAYAIVSREGPDHEPVFTVEMQAEGFDPSSGIGRTRQAAEQAAAAAFLRREGVWLEEATA